MSLPASTLLCTSSITNNSKVLQVEPCIQKILYGRLIYQVMHIIIKTGNGTGAGRRTVTPPAYFLKITHTNDKIWRNVTRFERKLTAGKVCTIVDVRSSQADRGAIGRDRLS